MIAESYERIHRSNLVGMGVLPLQYLEGVSTDSLRLTGTHTYTRALYSECLYIVHVHVCVLHVLFLFL